MTTLTSAPVSSVLERLFADAQRTQAAFRERMSRMTDEERSALPRDSREFFAALKDTHLAVSRTTGDLLYILARTRNARAIVEFGTSFGVSTVFLASALRDNGGGRLIGSEYEPSKAAAARSALDEAGLADLVEIREGDALTTFAADLPQPIDLVFLDGAKNLYLEVLSRLEPLMSAGALVVADNAGRSPDFLEHVRTSGAYVSSDVGNDVEVALRTTPAS